MRDPLTLLPVYYERWARLPSPSQPPQKPSHSSYLALRRRRDPPLHRNSTREAILIVVDGHFTLCVDRDPALFLHDHPTRIHLEHGCKGCKGGGAMYIDYLLQQCINENNAKTEAILDLARSYLDLEGSYGTIETSVDDSTWCISHSTHPWKEGQSIFDFNDKCTIVVTDTSLEPTINGSEICSLLWEGSNDSKAFYYGEWEVFECSYSIEELQLLFNCRPNNKFTINNPSMARSKL